jgi:hypothetical protein
MYVAGFCYATNTDRPGFKPNFFHTAKEAQSWIRHHFSGADVTFRLQDKKYRTYVNGHWTGYMYFKVALTTWALVDLLNSKKPIRSVGSLDKVKKAARRIVHRVHKMACTFDISGDVRLDEETSSHLVLVRI